MAHYRSPFGVNGSQRTHGETRTRFTILKWFRLPGGSKLLLFYFILFLWELLSCSDTRETIDNILSCWYCYGYESLGFNSSWPKGFMPVESRPSHVDNCAGKLILDMAIAPEAILLAREPFAIQSKDSELLISRCCGRRGWRFDFTVPAYLSAVLSPFS